jgi:CcmD family protein
MAETTNYMILGFSVIFGTILVYVWSLRSRLSRVKKDLALLQDLDEK